MRGRFGHAPGVAGGAHATALAGVGDQEIMLALVAVGAGESVGEDAAFEIDRLGTVSIKLRLKQPSRKSGQRSQTTSALLRKICSASGMTIWGHSANRVGQRHALKYHRTAARPAGSGNGRL